MTESQILILCIIGYVAGAFFVGGIVSKIHDDLNLDIEARVFAILFWPISLLFITFYYTFTKLGNWIGEKLK